MSWMCIFITCLLSVVFAQNDSSTLLESFSIPPELQGHLNDSDIEQVQNKILDPFKEKCEKNGHPESYDNVLTAAKVLQTCYNDLINMKVLQEEIDVAKPNGKVDEVFKKYCDKSPDFKNCFRNFTEKIRPCFSHDEQKNFKTLYNVTDQLLEFVCFKDGDRIALFIAEGGQECFQEKQEGLQNCFNETIDVQTQNDYKNMSLDSVFNLRFQEKECNKMTQVQKCFVGVLDSCSKSTSANIVDSLFNFIRSATPCKNFDKSKKGSPGGASGLTITSGTIFMALVTAMLI